MIDTRELRIGNLVTITDYGTLYAKVTVNLLKRIFERQVYSLDSPNIQPIELNEEVLFKCGFAKEKEAFKISLDASEDNFIHLDGKHLSLVSVDKKTDQKNKFKVPTDIEYLHQLQNLHFELTGKELDVKL